MFIANITTAHHCALLWACWTQSILSHFSSHTIHLNNITITIMWCQTHVIVTSDCMQIWGINCWGKETEGYFSTISCSYKPTVVGMGDYRLEMPCSWQFWRKVLPPSSGQKVRMLVINQTRWCHIPQDSIFIVTSVKPQISQVYN